MAERCPGLREIRKRTRGGVMRPEDRMNLAANVGRESRPHLAPVTQLPVFVVADDQCVDTMRARPVSADDELLLPIELELQPRAGALAASYRDPRRFAMTPSSPSRATASTTCAAVPGSSAGNKMPEPLSRRRDDLCRHRFDEAHWS